MTFSAESTLDRFIGYQHRAIRYHVIPTILLPGFGIIVIAIAFLHPAITGGDLKLIGGFAGTFISSLITLPIKEILRRKEKISVYKSLKLRLESATKKDQTQVEHLVWKLLEKTALE